MLTYSCCSSFWWAPKFFLKCSLCLIHFAVIGGFQRTRSFGSFVLLPKILSDRFPGLIFYYSCMRFNTYSTSCYLQAYTFFYIFTNCLWLWFLGSFCKLSIFSFAIPLLHVIVVFHEFKSEFDSSRKLKFLQIL